MLENTRALAGSRLPLVIKGLLALQVLSAFLSETKFVPDIRNNVGAFEATAVVLSIAAFAFYWKRDDVRLRAHPLWYVFLALFWFATLSLLHFLSPQTYTGFIQVVILLFLLVFLFVVFNLVSFDRECLLFLFRCFAISAFIVGSIVLVDQLKTGSYSASGLFRSRSQTGIYMMGAFWIVLIYQFWPGLGRLERLATYPVLLLALYCIATSLRQSVYVAMVVGVIGLTAGVLLGTGRNRIKSIAPQIFVALAALLLLSGAFDSFVPLSLFQREFGDLGAKVQRTTLNLDDDEVDNSPSFAILQREGAFRAFQENPILGIGWGAFYRSEYSPTGHELHSSTWRFPAELGIVGVIVYLSFLGVLFVRGVRLFLVSRGTPFELSALVTLVALVSYLVSHYYNRMFTDRPYWWMLVIFMAFDVYLEQAVGNHVREADSVFPTLSAQRATRGITSADPNL